MIERELNELEQQIRNDLNETRSIMDYLDALYPLINTNKPLTDELELVRDTYTAANNKLHLNTTPKTIQLFSYCVQQVNMMATDLIHYCHKQIKKAA